MHGGGGACAHEGRGRGYPTKKAGESCVGELVPMKVNLFASMKGRFVEWPTKRLENHEWGALYP